MIIKQLTVFLENKSGRLSEVSNLLGASNINMTAFSIADTQDFGILRAIVSEPEKAIEILKEHKIPARLSDVVCIKVPNQPGAMAKTLALLSDDGIQIEYLYAFSSGETATVVIRPGRINYCIDMLQKHKAELLESNDLYEI